jgi:hypothetical protein
MGYYLSCKIFKTLAFVMAGFTDGTCRAAGDAFSAGTS